MTEPQTAEILLELRRIGVNLTTLSEPLVGTGLRASEMRDWLHEIPDGAGLNELLRRLEDRARSTHRPLEVRWRAEPPRPAYRIRRERWWPTQPLLDAGTDLLMEEWDPFGIRLAGVDRERVAELTFHFFGPFLAPSGHIDPVTHATEMIASAERDHLALQPSPERHRRYLATRLRELVERYPVPPAKEIPARQLVVVVGDAVGPPPLDPEGVCARCHAFRTVACVTMQTEPPTSVRFCASCWREVRHEYVGGRRGQPSSVTERIVWLDRMNRPALSVNSRSWDDALDGLHQLQASLGGRDQQTDADHTAALAEIATQLARREDAMDGDMPAEIQAFVRQYAHRPPHD